MLLVEKFKTGTVIFKEGDIDRRMFIVLDGEVSTYVIRNGAEVQLAVVGKHDFFGEIEMYGNKPRGTSAKAIADTRVVVVKNRMQLEQFIGQYPAFSGKILRMMGERLATAATSL